MKSTPSPLLTFLVIVPMIAFVACGGAKEIEDLSLEDSEKSIELGKVGEHEELATGDTSKVVEVIKIHDIKGQFDDIDLDGISDKDDNCPTTPNPEQGDSNSDGIGDDCEQ